MLLKVEYSAVTEEECVTVQDQKCEIKYDTVQVKLFLMMMIMMMMMMLMMMMMMIKDNTKG